jgi:hypothetical protein
MGIEEGEEVQAKGMHNILKKIITENFPNLEKTMPIQVQEASRIPNRSGQNIIPHDILSLKQQVLRLVKSIEGCKREKNQIIYKGKPSKLQ